MARSKVSTDKGAMRIALSFLKEYYQWARVVKATKENGSWLVDIDVGAFKPQVIRCKVVASGDIMEYYPTW